MRTKKKTVTGVLKGYDQLLNLVLDEVEEQVQGNDIQPPMFHLLPFLTRDSFLWVFPDPEPRIRTLGLAVLRGPTITLLSPVDGLEEISNPFVAQD
jgi:U6 snRNA-associated Sm-like protein LSm7